jgi:hypothetical protein
MRFAVKSVQMQANQRLDVQVVEGVHCVVKTVPMQARSKITAQPMAEAGFVLDAILS